MSQEAIAAVVYQASMAPLAVCLATVATGLYHVFTYRTFYTFYTLKVNGWTIAPLTDEKLFLWGQ